MPEKLLDTLSYQQVTDLFAYLAAEVPSPPRRRRPPPPAPAAGKKLTVCLVSGSFEYKSDDSLAALQEYLEKNYPVRCTRAFAKSETEITGLDNLATADAAIFFTRRLKIAGDDTGEGEGVRRVRQADPRHPNRQPRLPELAGDGQARVRRRLPEPPEGQGSVQGHHRGRGRGRTRC